MFWNRRVVVVWRYIANRTLAFLKNILIGAKLFEYRTGYHND